mmetsp:Transcript_3944/g.7252  ORF Transcript_3944/g.7252 Transcript_3944/m.7252 type:complete len:158 (-) Transcript_3944:376-849(-)
MPSAITKVVSSSNEDAKKKLQRKKIFTFGQVSCCCFETDSDLYDLGDYIKDEYKSNCCCCCESTNTELIKIDSVVYVSFGKGDLCTNCIKFGCCAAIGNCCCPGVCDLPMVVTWKTKGGVKAYSVISEEDADRFELYFYEKYKEKHAMKTGHNQGML